MICVEGAANPLTLSVSVTVATGLASLMMTVAVNGPAVAKVCVPVTVKLPALPVMVAGVVVPSPQLIVTVKSAATFAEFALVNVAPAPVNGTPGASVKLTGAPTSSGTTVTLSVTVAVATGLASLIVTVAVNRPTAAYVCMPVTVKLPALPVMVAGVVVPSRD